MFTGHGTESEAVVVVPEVRHAAVVAVVPLERRLLQPPARLLEVHFRGPLLFLCLLLLLLLALRGKSSNQL